MARKSREQRFAPLEDESIREQIPKKILPLIEQLVLEQCCATNAAVTLHLKLLEIKLKELEKRLDRLDPPGSQHPSADCLPEMDADGELSDTIDEMPQDSWDDQDEDRDEEIPF